MQAEVGKVSLALDKGTRTVEVGIRGGTWSFEHISVREAKILGVALIEMAKEAENESQD